MQGARLTRRRGPIRPSPEAWWRTTRTSASACLDRRDPPPDAHEPTRRRAARAGRRLARLGVAPLDHGAQGRRRHPQHRRDVPRQPRHRHRLARGAPAALPGARRQRSEAHALVRLGPGTGPVRHRVERRRSLDRAAHRQGPPAVPRRRGIRRIRPLGRGGARAGARAGRARRATRSTRAATTSSATARASRALRAHREAHRSRHRRGPLAHGHDGTT